MVNKNFGTEDISMEIQELIEGCQLMARKKDLIMETIKQVYLSTSTNN